MREGPQLKHVQRDDLVKPVTEEEIKEAMFNIGNLKAPGEDGYGALFYKAYWDVVKQGALLKLYKTSSEITGCISL